MDYLAAIESDYFRLLEVTAENPDAIVPTCPEWTVDDLVSHVAHVYLHKAECMRHNAFPKAWTPPSTGEAPREMLVRAYGELAAEFALHPPESQAVIWFGPASAGFWQRRLAHETVIHRIDAELAAAAPSHPIPEDLALDGIDEALKLFLASSSRKWFEEFEAELAKGDGSILITDRWLVSWHSSGIDVTDVPATHPESSAPQDPTPEAVVAQGFAPAGPSGVAVLDPPAPTAVAGALLADAVDVVGTVGAVGAVDPVGAEATVAGPAEAVLRWLWRRADDSSVTMAGDPAKVAQLQELLRIATQ